MTVLCAHNEYFDDKGCVSCEENEFSIGIQESECMLCEDVNIRDTI